MSELQITKNYQDVIIKSKYSRWDADKNRRETWEETVDRYLGWITDHISYSSGHRPDAAQVADIRELILSRDVFPSMRGLQYAGEAMELNNVRMFNCTALDFNYLGAFSETMYLLLSGCGVGARITPSNVSQLGTVPVFTELDETTHIAEDTIEGWAEAMRYVVESVFLRQVVPKWDLSNIRPKGARIVTSGGFAPGPEPLQDILEYTINILTEAQGRELRPYEVYEIFTISAKGVVAGGSRRSALITVFSPNDRGIAESKSGDWYIKKPHFGFTNNSLTFEGRPSTKDFLNFWTQLHNSGSGEPGVLNEQAAREHAAAIGRDTTTAKLKVNPCCEIYSFKTSFLCNLTQVNIRSDDSKEFLLRKARAAAVLGYWQATVIDFNYLGDAWRKNAEEEMLMGVGLSGITDHEFMSSVTPESAEFLQLLRAETKITADIEAERIGMPKTTAWSTVKPAGNSSQASGTASGIHPSFAPFYTRNIQLNSDDPLTKFLKSQGVPNEPSTYAPNTEVFSFPRRAAPGAKTTDDMDAIAQLELWKHYKVNYATHTVSCTVYVREDEWMRVGAWVYDNFHHLIGVSFLPKDENTYAQAPYIAITEDQYLEAVSSFPDLDWGKLAEFDVEDTTDLTSVMECSGAGCDLI